jgi:hypothetical protein
MMMSQLEHECRDAVMLTSQGVIIFPLVHDVWIKQRLLSQFTQLAEQCVFRRAAI